jgi:hypothetical protein
VGSGNGLIENVSLDIEEVSRSLPL